MVVKLAEHFSMFVLRWAYVRVASSEYIAVCTAAVSVVPVHS